MYFDTWSYIHRKPIEDVYLPGDRELYAPVVQRLRRAPWGGLSSRVYPTITFEEIDRLIDRLWTGRWE